MEKENKNENKNETAAPEDATTVGMFLKYTRMKQKKSVDTVSEALCIRKIYITALEADDYETLSPIPYGVGFVRSYANYLGLNPDRVVQFYKKQYSPQSEQPAQTIVKTRSQKSIPTMRHILFGVAGVVCLYILWLGIQYFKSSEDIRLSEEAELLTIPEEVIPASEDAVSSSDEEQEVINQETPVDETNTQEIPEKETNVSDSSQIKVMTGNYVEETEPESSFKKMTLKFKGDSWMELKDNDKVYITGIFQKGFEYTVPSTEGLILSVGKYYNVEMYVDDVLTKIATPQKQTGIALDPILKH